MEKKKWIVLLAIVMIFTSMGLSGCGGNEAAPEQPAAATVLTNGIIYTVDGDDWENSAQEAIAIDGEGAILFVGTAADAEAYIGDETKVVDLEGKTVLPGFIDGHVHAPGTALTELYEIYLYESFTKEQTLADVAAFIEANPDLDEYWGNGFNMGMAADPKGPKKEWLDEIESEKPIIITSNDGHNMWMNSKAFEMNGITKETKAPLGGSISKDPATGEPWGLLTDAFSLVTMEPVYSKDQELAALRYFQEQMSSWGYTSIMSIAPHSVDVHSYKTLEDTGELNLRVNVSALCDEKGEYKDALSDALALRDYFSGSKLVKASTIKFFVDGVVEGMTGYLMEPYAPEAGLDPDYRSVLYYDPEDLKEYFSETVANDFQIHVHSIGDAATMETVNAMEYAIGQNPGKDMRNVITHLQLVRNEDKIRMGELGIIGAAQPYWHLQEPDWYEYVDSLVLGPDRAWTEYPLKSLADNGVRLTFSGDHPVSPVNNPFWAIEAAVTRNLNNAEYYGVDDITDIDDPTWLLNPDERISIAQAVEAYTINGAYQLFRDAEIGSLSVGKLADLVIISDDIINTNPLNLDGIEVIATILGGKAVYGTLD
ncbi:amidohydrolase [Bacillota bacterium]